MTEFRRTPRELLGVFGGIVGILGAVGLNAACGKAVNPDFTDTPAGTTTLAPDSEGHERVMQVTLSGGTKLQLVATYNTPRDGNRIVDVTVIDRNYTQHAGPYWQWCDSTSLDTQYETAGLPWLGGDVVIKKILDNAYVCLDESLTRTDPLALPPGFLPRGSQAISRIPQTDNGY